MYYFGQEDNYVLVECESCGKVYKFSKQYFTKDSEDYYIPNIPLQCKCGNQSQTLKKKKTSSKNTSNTSVSCPLCSSTYIEPISGFKKGASVLAFGVFAANTVLSRYKCKRCGHKF